MPRFEKSIDINVPPQKAFDYVSDIAKHADWSIHGLSVEKTSPGPLGVGTTFSTTGHQMGTHKGVVTIKEFVPGQKVVYESDDDTARVKHAFELTPNNGGTRITKSFETVKTGLMLTIFRPMMYIVQPMSLKRDLQTIKEKLEA